MIWIFIPLSIYLNPLTKKKVFTQNIENLTFKKAKASQNEWKPELYSCFISIISMLLDWLRLIFNFFVNRVDNVSEIWLFVMALGILMSDNLWIISYNTYHTINRSTLPNKEFETMRVISHQIVVDWKLMHLEQDMSKSVWSSCMRKISDPLFPCYIT